MKRATSKNNDAHIREKLCIKYLREKDKLKFNFILLIYKQNVPIHRVTIFTGVIKPRYKTFTLKVIKKKTTPILSVMKITHDQIITIIKNSSGGTWFYEQLVIVRVGVKIISFQRKLQNSIHGKLPVA